MSEQSTRVASQRSGDYIGTRDAAEVDADGHARVIQLVDFASRKVLLGRVRGFSTTISVADGADLDVLSEEMIDNLIEVGDKTILVVNPIHSQNDGEVHVTPILFQTKTTTTSSSSTSSSSTSSTVSTTNSTTTSSTIPYEVVGVQTTKGSSMGSVAFQREGEYLSPQLSWDVMGAEFVGLHVSFIGGSGNAVKLKAGMI